MFPVLFDIAGLHIHAYGFFIALGYLVSLVSLFFIARKLGLNPGPLLDLAFIAIISGVIGARLLFVALNFSYYWLFPKEALYLWKGGLIFYGGLFLAMPCCALYIKLRGLDIWRTLDALAPALAIGHAFGRIGCLSAGCCHGNATAMPWGVRLNSDLVDPILRNVAVHPTQLYESLLLFSLTGALIHLIGKESTRSGTVTLTYFMGYALIRSFVEIFRGDQIRGFLFGNQLSTSQFISMLLFGTCLFFINRRRRAI